MRHLRLVVDNDLAPREFEALRLVEQVTRTRLAASRLRGPGKAALDADVEQLRAVALRVADKMSNWKGGW